MSRVTNICGPSAENVDSTPAIQERLQNIERHIGIVKHHPIPEDIYKRLKALEERILFLESTSPEYFSPDFKKEEEVMNRIDKRIAELRHKLKSQ